MTTLNRRELLRALGMIGVSAATLPALAACNPGGTSSLSGKPIARDPATRLTISGPPAPPSALLVHMTESEQLGARSALVEYENWNDVRKLDAAIKAGQVHAGMASTSALAALKAQGAPIKLLNVFGWGILYLLAGEKKIEDWHTLRGSKIGIVQRGSALDAVFSTLAEAAKLEEDVSAVIRYAGDPLEAGEALAGKQVQTAVLAEPWAAMAIEKSMEDEDAVPIYRAMDLQEEWGKLIGPKPRIPLVGFFVTDQLLAEHPDTVAALETTLADAVAWAETNPEEAANIASDLNRLTISANADSFAHTQLDAIPAYEVREELDIFFQALYDFNPDLLGGALPDESFYVTPRQ